MRLAAIGAALAVLAASGSLAQGVPDQPGGPDCLPNTTFENDEVRIWFHSMTGFIKIFDLNTTSGDGMYFYKSRALTELDADGAAVSEMSLNRAFPGTSECEIEVTDEFVNMTITVTDTVRKVNGAPIGSATASIVYHFNTSSYGAKFDLIVNDWPWAAEPEDHTLAYDFKMVAGNLELEPAENGVGVKDQNGESQGYVEWAANATATYADETEEETNVTSSWTGNEHELDLRLEFTEVDGGYVELYYDPWMGIGDYIIVLNRLIGFAPLEQALPADAGRVLRSML